MIVRLVLAGLISSASIAHAIDCGTNVITLHGGIASPSTATVRDTSNVQSHAAYDLATGFAQISLAGSFYTEASLHVTDLYTVVGPGPTASFQARLHVTGSGLTNCNFRQQCSFVGGDLELAWNGNSAGQNLPKTADIFATLPITVPVGTPFRLNWGLSTFVSTEQPPGSVHYDAQLDFVGLPPGTTMVSCAGFHADGPVAATLTSWGRVRGIYR